MMTSITETSSSSISLPTAVVASASLSLLGRSFDVLVSLQSLHFPCSDGIYAPLVYLEANSHGQNIYFPQTVNDSLVLVLRGRVTLDTKVLHAFQGGAKGIIIVNTTSDPIGPDIDELPDIFVGCVTKEVGEELVRLLEITKPLLSDTVEDEEEQDQQRPVQRYTGVPAQIIPAQNILGYILCGNVSAVRRLLALYSSATTTFTTTTVSETEHNNNTSPLQVVDSAKHSPIHFAVSRESPQLNEILRLLLQSGLFDTNAEEGVRKESPLHTAAGNGCAQHIVTLLTFFSGASSSSSSSSNSSSGNAPRMKLGNSMYPIHKAAIRNRLECVEALHKHGADLCIRATNGLSPLQMAAHLGHVECTRYLLRAGCDARDAVANAKGLAAKYLDDVVGEELRYFVTGIYDEYTNEIATFARRRILEDLGEYIEENSIEIFVNVHGSSGSSDAATPRTESSDKKAAGVAGAGTGIAESFVSRYKQLAKSYSARMPPQITMTSPSGVDNESCGCQVVGAGGGAGATVGTAAPPLPNILPPLRFLWHGCDPRIVDDILKDGFKVSYSNLSFNVYGAGVYFATDAKLSAYFVTRNVREQKQLPPDEDGKYSLLLSVVSIGTVGTRTPLLGGNETQKVQMKADLKHPANRNPPKGCDSASGLFQKELVLYENSLAFPLVRIKFRLRSSNDEGSTVIIPDPYALEVQQQHKYLCHLSRLPSGLGKFSSLDGAPKTFDGSPLSIIENAPLLMNWTNETRGDSSTMDELLDRLAELEKRVKELETENVVLKSALRQ